MKTLLRRTILLFAFSLLLLLSACHQSEPPPPMVQPVTFFYRTASTDFSSEDGVIRGELRDLGTTNYTYKALFEYYFTDEPHSKDLVSPFSQDLLFENAIRRGSMLELYLVRAEYSPAEFSHALTYACLAKTGLALEGISKVRIRVSRPGGSQEEDLILSENEILLFDNGEVPANINVTLYYADEASKLLLTEQRSVPLISQENLPEYVLNLLLSPPENSGMRSPLPVGTVVQGTSVENGICHVYFNDDFCTNMPKDEQAAQLTVLSVVNTLCELEGINQVMLYAANWDPEASVYLDLSVPWIPDVAPLGPIREELGEFSGTLCLPGRNDARLHRLNIRARVRGSASREEALLLALLSRSSQNGLSSPWDGLPTPQSVSTLAGICQVAFEGGALPADPGERELLIRSITATLCSLPEVDAVLLTEQGTAVTPKPLSPAADWFCSTKPKYE